MQVRTLGRSGIEVPVLGAGCWGIGGAAENLGLPMGWSTADPAQGRRALDVAYARGVRLFDTADVYGLGRSERILGSLIGEIPRESVVITSKVGYFSGTSPHAYDPTHLRHQFEQTLENLQTSYLDIYFLHNNNFGPNDVYLDGVLEWMSNLRQKGLIRHIGMRGPHRYALDRLDADVKDEKVARFHYLAERVDPDILAVRDNLLSPIPRLHSVYEWAKARECGILINKPLGQGLLTGKYLSPREFGPGDHRLRKSWFKNPPLTIVQDAVNQLLAAVDGDSVRLLNLAIWACLERSEKAAVLTGFTNEQQIAQNVTAAALGEPDHELLELAHTIMGRAQQQLDRIGEVFVDEPRAKP